ncbi:MAG TPA: tetraacyldisaccharide 4'-kinase [Terriglobia bacterium]|nr:tetraacyldisaccharide 4'-kinase [Terriglobia bacterium]
MNPFLLPFSAGFRLGVALRHAAYRHGWFKTRRLARPVVSVGNLTVGGTGKTPLVAYVARILMSRGWMPSILTRGYARRSKAALVVVPPGEGRHGDAREIGDEPALLAGMLPNVPLIVCADRFRGGQVAEERFRVDAHILDDGFQHLALARDVDLVALDATQTISSWGLLPAGRQREPLTALQRAPMVVLTRTDSADPERLEELVRKFHPAAGIFRSHTKLVGCTDARSNTAVAVEEIRPQKVAAFCAIGNPRAFFGDLRRWGFNLVGEDAFPDHHGYTGNEIHELAARARRSGAAALLTTQKDAVKLSPDWTTPLPVLACAIELQIPAAEDFEKTLLSYLKQARS